MYTHRLALLGGAFLCASLLTSGSAAAQTPGATTTVDPSARRDIPIDAAPTPDIELTEAPTARRVLEDEARHRDRIARTDRLRGIYTERGDRERLARVEDVDQRERDRHDAFQRRERARLSEPSVRAVDDIVRRGGTFRARGRDIAVARQRQRFEGPAPERPDRDATRRDDRPDAAPTHDIDLAEAPDARRALEDEATHRDRVARIARLREIYSQRGDSVRLARLDQVERREVDRHTQRQHQIRRTFSTSTANGVDDIVRRGGTFRARGRDVAVARARLSPADRARVTPRDLRPDRGPSGATHAVPSSPSPTRSPTHDSNDNRSPR